MEIRLLTVDDAADFRDIRLRALSEEPSAFSASHEEEASRTMEYMVTRIREQWSLPENYILGAFKNGLLVGTVGFVREQKKKLRHKGTIWGMYVVPEARGEGIGKLLLNEVVRRSYHLEGLEKIVLTVTSNNKPAKKLYQNLGFRCYGVEKRALKVGHDYFDDEFMVLPISIEKC